LGIHGSSCEIFLALSCSVLAISTNSKDFDPALITFPGQSFSTLGWKLSISPGYYGKKIGKLRVIKELSVAGKPSGGLFHYLV
jgi:hypothetical protein